MPRKSKSAKRGQPKPPLPFTALEFLSANARIRAYVREHPEVVDTVRLMGGDEADLMRALLAQELLLR
jgi:hypothetical protein